MSDDFGITVLVWLASVVVITGFALIGALIGTVLAVGYGLFLVGRAVYHRVQRPRLDRQLRRVEQERSDAIRRIIAIRQAATRQMFNAADPRVVEGHAEEIDE